MLAATPKSVRLMLVCAILLASACGKEAPPRAVRVTPTPQPTQPARVIQPITEPLAARPSQPIDARRALGEPDAPITVIEYGDYQ